MKFIKTLILSAFLIFPCLLSSLDKANNLAPEANYELLLPEQTNQSAFTPFIQNNLKNTDQWSAFEAENGDWTVFFDEYTKTPVRAFGKAIKIEGFDKISPDNIERAARSFLDKYEAMLNIETSNIKLVRTDFVNHRYYLSFRQSYKELDVLMSEVELRIFENGNLMSFGIKYFNNINIDVKPEISVDAARQAACKGIPQSSASANIQTMPKSYILPIKGATGIDYRLVYEVEVGAGSNLYNAYIDAHTGELVWRYVKTYNANVNFQIKADVVLSNPGDSTKIISMPNEWVKVAGNNQTSDIDGKFTFAVSDSAKVVSTFEGIYAKVVNVGKPSATFFGQVKSTDNPYNLAWANANSHLYERNLYYYINYAHDYIKALDPSLSCMDRKIFAQIYWISHPNYGNSPNAFSKDDSITFIGVVQDTARMAGGPGVYYHEYGHSINNLFFKSKGVTQGMINGACHEGTADVHAAMMMDEPRIGVGVFTKRPLVYIRNCSNKCIYPDSLAADTHVSGEILSGAFWDLRLQTSLAITRNLAHYARYGLPDDPNTGVAFYEWLVETLVADDDDGDISNGTPHSKEIINAFNLHHISLIDNASQNFSHEAYPDTVSGILQYDLECKIGSIVQLLVVKPYLFYQVDNSKGKSQFMQLDTKFDGIAKKYSVSIPGQEKGALISYYFALYDSSNKKFTKIASKDNGSGIFNFSIGYKTKSLEEFESSPAWVMGLTSDDAKVGKWAIGKPTKLDIKGYGIIKPDSGYIGTGKKCLATGLTSPSGTLQMDMSGNSTLLNYLTNGITTATSAAFALDTIQNPLLQYYQYFYQFTNPFFSGLSLPPFIVQVSNDGGNNWINVALDTVGNQVWRKINIKFSNYATPTNNCKIRFIYKIIGPTTFGLPNYIGSIAIDNFRIMMTDIKAEIIDQSKKDKISLEYFPNTAGGTGEVLVNLKESQYINLKLYNSFGIVVANIENNVLNTGNHQYFINLDKMASGVYFINLKTQLASITKEIIIFK
ncbi:MAG: T9SS type A sorting domain-containing protein [Candidatus Kapabacteria bacterium]|nr:T9SS type A sorting domain-containing protein [Candidatus Kapabacteria bacterium]